MLRVLRAVLAAAFLLNGFGDLRQEVKAEKEEILLPVLMYHEVKRDHPGKDVILPEEMESDLRWLQQSGYTTVFMADILDYVYTGKPLPEKPILLTFDDGYESSYRVLFPLLKQYGEKAVICVIGKSADEFSRMPETGGSYVHAGWKELLEMRDSGCAELQNHSYDLHRQDGESRGCLRRWGEDGLSYELRVRGDVDRLQDELYRLTGNAASTFAYPYGFYSEELEGILEECGFLATLTCDFGMNRLSRDPDCLRGMKRICRSHGADLEKLLAQAEATLKHAPAA